MDYYRSLVPNKPDSKPKAERYFKYTEPLFITESVGKASLDYKNLKIKAKFNFKGKCEELWNAFDKPTQVTLSKCSLYSGRVVKSKERVSQQRFLLKRHNKSLNSGRLPPIKRDLRNIGKSFMDYELDSDDEFGVIVNNIYKD